MYLSAERLAVANQAVKETFEQSCVTWQVIPHWDTGDPGQAKVRSDLAVAQLGNMLPLGGDPLPLIPFDVSFYMSLAQLTAPTADALLAAVIARTVYLAGKVDTELIDKLLVDPQPDPEDFLNNDVDKLVSVLIDARVDAENRGYRAPSCLLTDKSGLKSLSQFDGGCSVLGGLLDAANINSLYRVDRLAGTDTTGGTGSSGSTGTGTSYGKMLLIGRRQRIAHGGAPSASPGEEPVDLAVSVPPSLEVVDETSNGLIELAVRIRLAVRVKDKYGVIGVKSPTP